jgi:hypothetical protein
MFLFGAMVSEKARKLVTETAVHFTSRDHAKFADQVLVPRLKALA